MEKEEQENLKEFGFDFEKGTYNLDKLSGFSGFHALMKDIEFDLHRGSSQKKLIDFINALLSLARAERVICSAIRMPDGYIVRGHRHSDCIKTASEIPRYKKTYHAWGENQGFVTSENRYVDRLEGARIQKAAGIKSKMPEGQEYLHGELYSEDLY